MKKTLRLILSVSIMVSSLAAEAQPICGDVHLKPANAVVLKENHEMLQLLRENAEQDFKLLSPQKRAQLQKEAKEVSDAIYRLQIWADRTRKFNSNYEHVASYNARRRLYFLKQDIQLGYKTHAVGLYRELFHRVENSYLTLKDNLQVLSKIRKNSKKAITLRKENKKLFKIFGENFEEYLSVRTYLEGMSLADPALGIVPDLGGAAPTKNIDPRPISRDILGDLGIPAEHKLTPNLDKPKERVSIESLVDFFGSNPESTVAKLKQDIRDDIIIFGKSLILDNPVLSFMRAATARLPQRLRVFVTKVLDVLLERHLVHRYMNHIDDVINADESVQIQLDMLRSKNDSTDELLVTFARLTMYSPKWAEIRNYAHQVAEQTNSKLYVDFAQRMDKSEKLAVRLGGFFPGTMDVKAVLARSGVATASGYLLFHYQIQILNWMERALGLGAEAMGFAYEATRAMVSFN